MTELALGRLERVDLRKVWTREDTDFTPWLAKAENLGVLAETLAIELELEAQERSVGPFRADILCKDIGTDTWVLVENQLERTDHSHLGQLLTYASGLQAVTIVWVAQRFTEEHRATLDWLNQITDESFRFFGLEVELWRIGNSLAAPKFNVVSKPNDWSRSVAKAARAIDDEELSDIRALQRDYWSAFNQVLVESDGPFSSDRKALPQSWMQYSIGRTHFSLNSVMLRQKNQVRAELYMTGNLAKIYLGMLEQERAEIEREIGYALEWEKLPEKRDCRISIHLDDADPETKTDWPRQHRWLAERLNQLHRVFSSRVKALDASDWQDEAS